MLTKTHANAETVDTVERERERERESYSLKDIAVLACVKASFGVLAGKLYIIYKELKVNMLLLHRETVF